MLLLGKGTLRKPWFRKGSAFQKSWKLLVYKIIFIYGPRLHTQCAHIMCKQSMQSLLYKIINGPIIIIQFVPDLYGI